MKNQKLLFGVGAGVALLFALKKITSSGLRIKDVSNSLPTNGRWQLVVEEFFAQPADYQLTLNFAP